MVAWVGVWGEGTMVVQGVEVASQGLTSGRGHFGFNEA